MILKECVKVESYIKYLTFTHLFYVIRYENFTEIQTITIILYLIFISTQYTTDT